MLSPDFSGVMDAFFALTLGSDPHVGICVDLTISTNLPRDILLDEAF